MQENLPETETEPTEFASREQWQRLFLGEPCFASQNSDEAAAERLAEECHARVDAFDHADGSADSRKPTRASSLNAIAIRDEIMRRAEARRIPAKTIKEAFARHTRSRGQQPQASPVRPTREDLIGIELRVARAEGRAQIHLIETILRWMRNSLAVEVWTDDLAIQWETYLHELDSAMAGRRGGITITKLANNRIYRIIDTRNPYVPGEYPSGGKHISTRLRGRWMYVDNAPDQECVANFLKVAERLCKVNEVGEPINLDKQ